MGPLVATRVMDNFPDLPTIPDIPNFPSFFKLSAACGSKKYDKYGARSSKID